MSNIHFNHYRKGVVCLNYNVVYESATLASKLTGCARTSIVKCCTGERDTCYNHLGVRLRWMYLSDYVKLHGLDRTLELNYIDRLDYMEEVHDAKLKLQD